MLLRSMRQVAFAGIGALLLSLVSPLESASATACTSGYYRTSDYTNHVSAFGINSQLTVPQSIDLWGFGTGMPSAGDVGLLNYSSGDFVQYGWYVGSATGLPYASIPRVFFGEWNLNTASETLTAGPYLNWGESHNFRILKNAAGAYAALLDGTQLIASTYAHPSLPTPQMTGETDALCTRMHAVASRNPSPPARTLYYATGSVSSPTWNLFVDVYLKSADTSRGTFVSTSAGDQASFYGYGGG